MKDSFEKTYFSEAEVAPVPKHSSLRRTLGPGIIILATAMGSGEIFFWPGIAASYGFQFIWLIIFAVLFQYVLNTEFIRYTLATGEPVIQGFSRLWGGFTWVFLACAILPWLWPGWAMGGATALTWVFGGDATTIGAISLVCVGLLLTTTKNVYQTLETAQKIMIALVMFVAVVIAGLVVRKPSLDAMVSGFSTSPLPIPDGLALASLLAAMAFCGAGGSINLATSNWARDKGLGMAEYSPKIISPFSGERIAEGNNVYSFNYSEQNIHNWNGWWKVTRREQSITFLAIGLIGLILFMLIAHALVANTGFGIGMGTVQEQSRVLEEKFGNWMRVMFALCVAAVFLTSAVGVLDHAARLASCLLSNKIKNRNPSQFISSESGIYFIVLWLMIGFGLFVLLGLDVASPPVLLTIAGALSGIVMFIYSLTIIWLNAKMRGAYNKLDSKFVSNNPFNISLARQLALWGSVSLYGILSCAVIYNTWNAITN